MDFDYPSGSVPPVGGLSRWSAKEVVGAKEVIGRGANRLANGEVDEMVNGMSYEMVDWVAKDGMVRKGANGMDKVVVTNVLGSCKGGNIGNLTGMEFWVEHKGMHGLIVAVGGWREIMYGWTLRGGL